MATNREVKKQVRRLPFGALHPATDTARVLRSIVAAQVRRTDMSDVQRRVRRRKLREAMGAFGPTADQYYLGYAFMRGDL